MIAMEKGVIRPCRQVIDVRSFKRENADLTAFTAKQTSLVVVILPNRKIISRENGMDFRLGQPRSWA